MGAQGSDGRVPLQGWQLSGGQSCKMNRRDLSRSQQAGHPPNWHQLWFVTFLAVFSKTTKPDWLASTPSRHSQQLRVEAHWQASLGSLDGCCLTCTIFWRNMLFAVMNLAILHTLILRYVSFFWQNVPWLSFYAVQDKCLPKPTSSPPDPMVFDKENAPLLCSYNVQAQSKHQMPHPS